MQSETAGQTATPLAFSMRACAQCGAGLALQLGAHGVRCSFCGLEQVVAEPAPHVEAPHAMRADHEGREALHRAFLHAHGIDKGKWIAAGVYGLIFMPLAVLRVSEWFGVRHPNDKSDILLASLSLLVVGLPGYIVWRVKMAPRRAQRDLDAFIMRPVAAERGTCPNCGALVQVPPRATLSCCFCQAPLVVCHGMLLRWLERAEERKREWDRVAARVVKEGTQRRRAAGETVLVIAYGLMMAITMLGLLVDLLT